MKKQYTLEENLILAIENEALAEVKNLLAQKPDLNFYANFPMVKGTALTIMVKNYFETEDNLQILQELLSQTDLDFSQHNQGLIALLTVIQNKNLQFMEMLLKDPRMDVNQCTAEHPLPLLHAIERKNLEALNMLLSSNKLDFKKHDQGNQALALAKQKGNPEILALLTESISANTDIQTTSTPAKPKP